MHDHDWEPELRDAARQYRRPPSLDDQARDAMWAEIDARAGARDRREHRWPLNPWIGLAAAVVLGIGIARFTPLDRAFRPAPDSTVVAVAPARLPVPAVYESTTSQYLGQTAALLISLPSEVHAGRTDAAFIGRAQNLLLTTRLLLDSPAAKDAKLHGLLEDLELVLAQVVRLQYEQNSTDLDLINQALEQHDVLPRLRTAAADISAD
jgi:hypothetical protein